MSIKSHAQTLALDPRITLYEIDLTTLGGGVQRFVPMSQIIGEGKKLTATEAVSATGAIADESFEGVPPSGEFAYFKMVLEKGLAGQTLTLQVGFSNYLRAVVDMFDPDGNQPVLSSGGTASTTGYEAYSSTIDDTHMVVVFKVISGSYMTYVSATPSGSFASGDTLALLEYSVYFGKDDSTVLAKQPEHSGLDRFTEVGDLTFVLDESPMLTTTVRWRGSDYTPLPVEADGFDLTSSGQLPRPRFRMANVLGTATQMAASYANMLGAKVTRYRTFRRFLDDGLTPDPNAYLPLDIYYVDRKVSHGLSSIEWELASILDQQGSMLPGRQVIRSGCQLLYRRYDSGGAEFDYSSVNCPYAGSTYFDADDNPTADPAEDRCSQQLTGCRLRFAGGDIPFGGFPSVGRIRR